MDWKQELHDVVAMLFGPALGLRRGILGLMHALSFPWEETRPEDPVETDVPVLELSFAYPFDTDDLPPVRQAYIRLHPTLFALLFGYLYMHTVGLVTDAYRGIALIPVGYIVANWAFLATWDLVGLLVDAVRGLEGGGEFVDA